MIARKSILPVFLAVLLCASVAHAQPVKIDSDGICGLILQGGDVADKAIAEVRELFKSPDWKVTVSATMAVRYQIGHALLEAQRFEECLDICRLAINYMAGTTEFVEQLQEYRIEALLALGRHDDALANAKVLYNVASMKGTARAMRVFCQCLELARPDDKGIIDRFKAEQIAGAKQTLVAQPRQPGTVLGSIRLSIADSRLYEDRIAKNRQASVDDMSWRSGLGNGLLLEDRPDEALQVMEELCQATTKGENLKHAIENVARAIKAQDGAIGRANAYIMHNRSQAR